MMPMRMTLAELAARWDFLSPPTRTDGEALYRAALADHIAAIDPPRHAIEAYEVRIGKPWDEMNTDEQDQFTDPTLAT
jgi:hypothetical protein